MNQPKGIEPFLEPLESLQRLLSRFNERGVIIGGAAVSILGKARYTEDIDAMFLLSIKDIPQLLEPAKRGLSLELTMPPSSPGKVELFS